VEPEITKRYNDQILDEAIRRFDIPEDQIALLDGFESYIYEFERDDAEYILRVGHSRRRTVDLIRGEVDWINHLSAGGAGVAHAITSSRGELVEAIDDDHGGQFLVTAFQKAPGRPSWEAGWSPELYQTYGKLLGRIHALSKSYTPADPAWRRPEWNDPSNLDVLRWLPESEPRLIERFRQIDAYLEALPRDDESYGLIHQDAHPGNFFVDDAGRITLFDFDDSVYSWYVYDIAMVVFYMIVVDDDPEGLLRSFWPQFWAGYCEENTLDPIWLAEIPHFMKLREVDNYALLHRSYGDLEAIDPDEDRWVTAFLRDRKRRIEENVPLVDFDFT
jgi:Ser/Thr protein kinase RdoA (MazF antagonist)